MPSASALYSSGRWLNASDLVEKVGLGKHVTAIVQHVEPGTIGMGTDQKEQLILDLVSRQGQPWPKKLTLNQTRNMAMIAAYGDDYSQWTGKVIEVWAENVLFAGKPVPGIKVGPAPNSAQVGTQQTQHTSPAHSPPSAAAVAGVPPVGTPVWNSPRNNTQDLDDEIPF